MKKKITLKEFRSLIKEEANRLKRIDVLKEKKKALQEELGMMGEDGSEMWDRDASHTDTYSDTSYEDNWDNNEDMPDEDIGDAEFILKKNPVNPKYNTYVLSTEDEGVIDNSRWSILKTPKDEEHVRAEMKHGRQIHRFYKAIFKGEEVKIVVYPYEEESRRVNDQY